MIKVYSCDGTIFRFEKDDYILQSGEDVLSSADNIENVFPGYANASLSAAKSSKISQMKILCGSGILAGFSSSALGSSASYGASSDDQRNIWAAATHGGNIWCNTGQGWNLLPHTQTQASQVSIDLWSHIQLFQGKYSDKITSINALTDIASVDAITWD